jgi:hypothetical protein
MEYLVASEALQLPRNGREVWPSTKKRNAVNEFKDEPEDKRVKMEVPANKEATKKIPSSRAMAAASEALQLPLKKKESCRNSLLCVTDIITTFNVGRWKLVTVARVHVQVHVRPLHGQVVQKKAAAAHHSQFRRTLLVLLHPG